MKQMKYDIALRRWEQLFHCGKAMYMILFPMVIRMIDLPGRYVPDLYHIVWSKLVFRRQQIAGAVMLAGGSAWRDPSQREGDRFIVQLFQDFQK